MPVPSEKLVRVARVEVAGTFPLNRAFPGEVGRRGYLAVYFSNTTFFVIDPPADSKRRK